MSLRWVIVLLCIFAAGTVLAESPKHLTMEEIVVTDEAVSEPTATVIGAKTIERGRNVNIPDVLKNEPEFDIRRRASIGDTGDILAIRGLSSNRIMLNRILEKLNYYN